ncbi:MAG: alpha-ketoacid dehydrogenase subunit beta [Planctomycetes bacterium]|nr:alpha-ketoacid dehydrogenase subunit beta [Planctomycetota bacterium]
MRTLTYAAAIREAHAQLLSTDSRVFVIGQGLWSPWYAGNTLKDLDIDYGADRVIDSPVSENATTGAAIGAAISGMRPIVFHPRMDFMLLAVDPIVNQAANWSYVFDGKAHVPIVIRSVINRRGEQGAQHSQALQAMYAHIPGLKVVMPSCAEDAKGLLIAASQDGNPVIYIDDRMLYEQSGVVPKEIYATPIGKAAIRRKGTDVSIVATSRMVVESIRAAELLSAEGIEVEVIDLRTIKPLDLETILNSVSKTSRLVVVDEAWKSGSVASEVSASVSEQGFDLLRAPIHRVCLGDCPAPSSKILEEAYYLTADDIIRAVRHCVGHETRFRKAA